VAELLTVQDLPDDFVYPPEFIRIVELGLTDLEPWKVLDGDHLRTRFRGLVERYPARVLVPFARRQDNDDVACWDPAAKPGQVVVVHDFADPGWENGAVFPGFYDWLRQAIEDLIDFG